MASMRQGPRPRAFSVETLQGRIEIHVGEKYSDLDALFRANDCATWAYVTVFNPGSVRRTRTRTRRASVSSRLQSASSIIRCFWERGSATTGRGP